MKSVGVREEGDKREEEGKIYEKLMKRMKGKEGRKK